MNGILGDRVVGMYWSMSNYVKMYKNVYGYAKLCKKRVEQIGKACYLRSHCPSGYIMILVQNKSSNVGVRLCISGYTKICLVEFVHSYICYDWVWSAFIPILLDCWKSTRFKPTNLQTSRNLHLVEMLIFLVVYSSVRRLVCDISEFEKLQYIIFLVWLSHFFTLMFLLVLLH